ncbi:proteophosphoglycan ppg4 [Moniliophthora roreri]|uniref:Proteophosphoglycan ppg4 n=1 Tax=Moniliophthora roreri TaxID=221103 RepID=A0A0W0FVU2_MONRR|nr:proteophosphoglycan ppg4 [Moniliophthora roreri]
MSRLRLISFTLLFISAYLTNPSETSFRAYLTELSFRQHLSRLDNIDDDHDIQDKTSSNISFRHSAANAHPTPSFENRSPFHFANRASVSLRTPKHVFHSFGIFTIAAIIPAAKSDRSINEHRDMSMISDSWFIGAFGKWWRGGVLETWYQDVIARSGNEESWSSGILGMKTLDRLNEYNALPGLPFSTKNLPPHGLSRGSPPRLRNREKSSQRSGLIQSRSSTPPPLPKSASLPLHTPRNSQSHVERSTTQSTVPSSSSQPVVATEDPHALVPSVPTQATSFDQSPRVAELLHQISLSKSSVLDLRNQLAEYQASAAQSRNLLRHELESCRDRKKQEDSVRNDLKSRTKTLDDSKRVAEGVKRDAEKRLRAAENARDDALRRMEHLDKEISTLRQRLVDDENSLRESKETTSEVEREVTEAIERKRREIRVAEDVIAALNTRARDLEDRLAQRTERLQLLREQAELRKRDQVVLTDPPTDLVPNIWPSVSPGIPLAPSHSPTLSSRPPSDTMDHSQQADILTNGNVLLDRARRTSDPRDRQLSSHPTKLFPGNLSNFSGDSIASTNLLNSGGYFDPPFMPYGRLSQPITGSFSPFGDVDGLPQTPAVVLSPGTSSTLISTSLISSLDNVDGVSRSFQSDNDAFLERDWRDKAANGSGNSILRQDNSQMTTSPVTDEHHDPFEVRMYSPQERDRYSLSSRSMDLHAPGQLHRNNSDPTSPGHEVESIMQSAEKPKRWFSMKDKPRKGLNPDAKAFDIFRKSQPVAPSNSSSLTGSSPVYDALNPTSLGSNLISSTTSDSSTLLRAFAPSPAEREALQRALGGSSNASLERLPSLSDVGGSIPPSPNHVHAQAVGVGHAPQRDLGKIPSWLQSLPLIKPNFSPWDDEEPVTSIKANVNGVIGGGGRR